MSAELYTHLNHRRGEPCRIFGKRAGTNGNMYCLKYDDGHTYDAYPNQVVPYTEPKPSLILTALEQAESFISGFEDDETQEGVPEMLKLIRDAIQQVQK